MKSNRLFSLDILRGFDMFWIIGGELLIWALRDVTDYQWLHFLGEQMLHVEWEGFHFYDLIFPLFMFVSGVSIPYSVKSQRVKGISDKLIVRMIIKRALILILLGFVYNGLLDFNIENLRFASVLGQIGVAYLIAALVNLYAQSIKKIVWVTLGILIGISILQLLVPVPSFGPGVMQPEGNINAYIDGFLLPGKFNGVIFDSQGIICMISAAVLPLMGSIVGLLIQKNEQNPVKLSLALFVSGVVVSLLGLVIGIYYPIIKHLWTTSFNLLTGGISIALMASFYYVIDVKKMGIKFLFIFKIIGLNSILIYMAHRMISFWTTSNFLFGGIANISGAYKDVVLVLGFLIVELLFLWILYKNRIFIKI